MDSSSDSDFTKKHSILQKRETVLWFKISFDVWSSVFHHREVCAKTGSRFQTGTSMRIKLSISQPSVNHCSAPRDIFKYYISNSFSLLILISGRSDSGLWGRSDRQFGHDYTSPCTASETAVGHVWCLHQMMGSIISIFHKTDSNKARYHWVFWYY